MTQDNVYQRQHRRPCTRDDSDNGLCHGDGGDMPSPRVMPSLTLVSRAILPHSVKTVVTRGGIGYYRPPEMGLITPCTKIA